MYLLANLSDQDRQTVFWGPQLRRDNRVVSFAFKPTDLYGQRRGHFVIARSDGTRCWLHPTCTSEYFWYGEEDQPPKAGRGAADFKNQFTVLKKQNAEPTQLKLLRSRAEPKAAPQMAAMCVHVMCQVGACSFLESASLGCSEIRAARA